MNFFAGCGLPRPEKCPYQFAFAANGHPRKSLEPLACGNLGLGFEPLRKVAKLGRRDFPRLNAIKEMTEKLRR